jgi:hypothetical protein
MTGPFEMERRTAPRRYEPTRAPERPMHADLKWNVIDGRPVTRRRSSNGLRLNWL